MALAVVHVVGAFSASFVFSILVLAISRRVEARVIKRRLQDASIALGIPVASLEADESLIPRMLEYSSRRFSGELLRNRLSDLCGALRTAWLWLGTLLQGGIIVAVGWGMYDSGAQNAVYMWAVLPVAIFFWLAAVAFSFTCLLLTGRYPGEANAARKALAAFIEQRNTSMAATPDRPLAGAWES